MPSLLVLIAVIAGVVVIGGLVVGVLAARRERGFGTWFLLSLLLTPLLSLPLLFALGRPCPRCGEVVRAGAKICKHCHYVLDRGALPADSARPEKVDVAWTETPTRPREELPPRAPMPDFGRPSEPVGASSPPRQPQTDTVWTGEAPSRSC